MNHRVLLCLLLLVGFCAPGANSLIFSNATLVDVESGLLRTAVAVTVQGDRITALEQARQLDPPADAQVIDCTGTFIMPGLWDMHTHVLWEAADQFLPLCIANGVTGVRDLHTTLNLERVQALRREIQERKHIGPRFLYSGPILDGPEPHWPGSISVHSAEEARQEVRRLHAGGVDMIKVYEFLSRESFQAIVDECRQLGLPLGGHVPQSMTSLECSQAGQRTIEHLSDVLSYCGVSIGENDPPSTDPDADRTARVQRALASAIDGRVDTNLWPQSTWEWFRHEPGRIWRNKMLARGRLLGLEFVRETAQSNSLHIVFRVRFQNESTLMTFDLDPAGRVTMARTDYLFDSERATSSLALFRNNQTWHCPTLTVRATCYRDREEIIRDPRRRYISPAILQKARYEQVRRPTVFDRERFEQYLLVVKAMNDAGVGLLAGTDTPLGSIPGFALHTELALLVRAGLTPAEALRSATINPARCFRLEKDLGTVAAGKLADLTVLDANPLQDIHNTTRIHAVVANGRYYSRSDLDKLLADCESHARLQK